MKRKYILAVLCTALLSVTLVTGCGTTTKESTAKEETTQEENTTETATEKTEETTESSTDDTTETTDEVDDVDFFAVDDAKTEEAAEESTAADADRVVNQVNTDELLTGKHHAEIVIKDYGTIEVELDADTAPISVTNFVKLAEADFYDGLTFHRIIDGFMMQGGDPKGNGTGGSDETIKGEFSANGVENNLSHERGVISMARSSAPDSASSQFFIVQTDATYLDGQYAAFGTVTEGMDIVDKICKEAVPVDSNGLIATEEQPVIETIDILD